MVIYTFEGIYVFNATPTSDFISIVYNESSGNISAETRTAGTPRISYEEYIPSAYGGQKIASIIEGTNQIDFYFQEVYPFAFAVTTEAPDPVIPVTPLIINSIVVVNQSAPGISDGSATISASGGTSPYTYSIDGLVYQTSNVFSGLSPGSYTLSVKDSDGAITTGIFNIVAAVYPPQPPIQPIIQDVIALAGADIDIQNAYKRVSVKTVFGKVPSVIYNGDFESYDGHNWKFWTKFGNINVSRIQRTVLNSNKIEIPIENYGIVFNEKTNTGRYLEHDPVPVQQGDTFKISYKIGNTTGTGTFGQPPYAPEYFFVDNFQVPATRQVFYECKIRIKVGNYYLYNENSGNGYQWVNQLAIINHNVSNPDGGLGSYNISFNIPECPVSGSMVIQLYGFQKVQIIRTQEFKPNPFVTIPPITQISNLNDYSPISLDDFNGTKSSQSADNDVDGIFNITDNLRYFTEKPDTFEVIFGDFFYRSIATQQLDNLYSMRIGDQNTSEWYEFGVTSTPISFGMSLAKSIIKSYQQPFRFWRGDVELKKQATSFNYLNVFLFNVPEQPSFNRRQFVVLGGDIDLKYNTFNNVVFAETFSKEPRTSDNPNIPAYPGDEPPEFAQDPNANTNNGIFTEEFTQEFN